MAKTVWLPVRRHSLDPTGARPLSTNARKVLIHLGKSARSIDELAARTGIRKDKLAKTLWHLRDWGWICIAEETRRLPVYRRLRAVPAAKRTARGRKAAAPHIAALNAAFGIAADDAHGTDLDVFQGWIMLKARELTVAAFLDDLRTAFGVEVVNEWIRGREGGWLCAREAGIRWCSPGRTCKRCEEEKRGKRQ